jgi:hypothetical protein
MRRSGLEFRAGKPIRVDDAVLNGRASGIVACEVQARTHLRPVTQDLEVEMRAGGAAGRADSCDRLAWQHYIVDLYEDP